jgi:O-antigen ligase
VLAIVQALTGNTWLNKPVSGALPTIAVTDGVAWVRPTGTMLQTGTLAAFFLLPTLVALALVMRYRRGPLLVLAYASLAVITPSVLFAGSRAVWATLTLAAAALLVYLLWNRRLLALAAVPLSIAVGYAFIAYQPLLGGAGSRSRSTVTYHVTSPTGVRTVTVELGSAQRGSAEGAGEVIHATGGGPWRRIGDQLDELAEQGIVGHGTGRLALGSQYVQPTTSQAGESEYVRIAHELGLPALVLYVVFLIAVWAAAAWASFIAYEWRRSAAVVALGTATLVPILSALTFAFDYPVVAILYYTLSGCALAWAARQGVPAPSPTAHAALRAETSAAPTPARS